MGIGRKGTFWKTIPLRFDLSPEALISFWELKGRRLLEMGHFVGTGSLFLCDLNVSECRST